MGQEVNSSRFNKHDFSRFRQRLNEETALLSKYFQKDMFCREHCKGGFEIEACLVDPDMLPAARNVEYIKKLNNPMVVPELALFNVELNSSPQKLSGHALESMFQELDRNLNICKEVADTMAIQLVMTGILPTIRDTDLSMANISEMNRYYALNNEILKLRDGRPLYLNIKGEDSLALAHYDVMLEAATTSFQVHMQIDAIRSARYYNAAVIASAPIVAACANSPFLFGKHLWHETRIPLFEQAVEVGQPDKLRVTFGNGYIRGSIMECFEENITRYPVLIPGNTDDDISKFSHLRFHNGTIWRWNRPLIGFDDKGSIHLRLEHRVIPAGPAAVDSIANAALFYGYSSHLVNRKTPPENELEFDDARDNFYRCARYGLEADITWSNKKILKVDRFLIDEVIPAAREGLSILGIDEQAVKKYLDIIEDRVRSGQNGAVWQTRYVRTNAVDMALMCRAYLHNQQQGIPVHEWDTRC